MIRAFFLSLLFHTVYMKFLLTLRRAIFFMFSLSCITSAAVAQIVTNGGFETRNSAPHNNYNLGPIDQNHPYNDLPYWNRTPTIYNENTAFYAASDGVPTANPTQWGATYGTVSLYPNNANYRFNAHSGIGCLIIFRHIGGKGAREGYVTEQLSTPLLGGHTYQVQCWVLRLPGDAYDNRLSLSITTALPTYDSRSRTLSPSPGNKVITSPYIMQNSAWTLVSGTITIPTTEGNTNQWLTISNSIELETYNPSAGSTPGFSEITYAVDDVSITEVVCSNPGWVSVAGHGPEACPDNSEYFDITGFDPSLTYKVRGNGYTALPSTLGYGTVTPNQRTFRMKGGGGISSGSFTITASRTCGTIVVQGPSTEYEVETAGGCDSPSTTFAKNQVVAYPNPAVEVLAIPAGSSEAVLLDEQGNVVRSIGKNGKLDVQGLPNGLYNLRMQQGGKTTNQRIQVQH